MTLVYPSRISFSKPMHQYSKISRKTQRKVRSTRRGHKKSHYGCRSWWYGPNSSHIPYSRSHFRGTKFKMGRY